MAIRCSKPKFVSLITCLLALSFTYLFVNETALAGFVTNLEQQINIIDKGFSTTSTTSAPADNSLGIVKFDSTKLTGDTVYFEAILKSNNTANVGLYTSIYCPTSDNCKIVYQDSTNGNLKFTDCDDETCSTGTTTIVDGGAGCGLAGCSASLNVGGYNKIYCSASNNCKIAYMDVGNSALMFADCDDETCSSGTITNLDGKASCAITGCNTAGNRGNYISLQCPSSDNCKITNNDAGADDLYFIDCGNETCSTGTNTLLDGAAGCTLTNCVSSYAGRYTSMDCVGGSDNCKIAYGISSSNIIPNYGVKFADCDNETCTAGTISTLDGTAGCSLTNCSTSTDVGKYIFMDCPTADNCKISFQDVGNTAVRFADCNDETCATGSLSVIDGAAGCGLSGCDSGGAYGNYWTSLTCPSATDCKIAYWRQGDALRFADCDDETCSTGSATTPDGDATCSLSDCSTSANVGASNSVYCSSADNCKVSHWDQVSGSSGDLRFVDCDNVSCTSGRVNIPDSGGTVVVGLYDTNGVLVTGSELTSNQGTYERKRSSSLTQGVLPNLESEKQYSIRIKTDGAATTGYIQSARLIARQSDNALAQTQTQVEIGDAQDNFSNTSYETIGHPKIYLFDSNRFSDTKTIYFESTLHTDDGANTVSARLIQCASSSDCLTGTPVPGSEISHTGDINWTWKRSNSIELNTGVNYAVQIKTSGGTSDIASGKLIIEQNSSNGISAVETLLQLTSTSTSQASGTFVNKDYVNLYNPSNFTGDTVNVFAESTIRTSAGTGYFRLFNDTDLSALTNTEKSTVSTGYERIRTETLNAYMPLSAKNIDIQIKNSSTDTTSVSSSWMIVQISGPSEPVNVNNPPNLPTSLGPSSYTNGDFGTNRNPDLEFTLEDQDETDTLKYNLQIDNNNDFSSPEIDFTSPLSSNRNIIHTVSTPLQDGSYYWRVKAIDNSDSESEFALANVGNISFKIDATAPTKPTLVQTTSPTSDTTPTWTWIGGSDSGSGLANPTYFLQWSKDKYFLTGVSSDNTNSTSYTHNTNLEDGTWYMRILSRDNAGNISAYSAIATVIVDSTSPVAFALDSPTNNSYTNLDRPTFKWKTASTEDALSGLSKYKLEIENGDTGDFVIDDISPTSSSNYETNKYSIIYENFNDNDGGNNYISVHTKSTSEWGKNENDGKLNEGKRSWKVIAIDKAGNTHEESWSVLVDLKIPKVELLTLNDVSTSTSSVSTTDQSPTLSGKISDLLSGDKERNTVASGPKSVEIKIEKKGNHDSTEYFSLTNINIKDSYWASNGKIILNNSENTADKYATFTYTPEDPLPKGNYRITIIGKDQSGNLGESVSINLKIDTVEKIATPEEKEVINEKVKDLPTEEKESSIKEVEITHEENEPEQKPSNVVTATSKEVEKVVASITKIFSNIGKYFQNINKSDKVAINKIITSPKQLISRIGNWLSYATSSFGEIVLDNKPTQISEVRIERVSATSAVIYWKTNHHATSKVNFGVTTDYGNDVQSDIKVKEHRIEITGLKPSTKYNYEVMSNGKNYVYDANHEFSTPKE